jgi:hypothetical protein
MSGVKGLLSQLFKPQQPIDTTPLSPPPPSHTELESKKMPPKPEAIKKYPVYERLHG